MKQQVLDICVAMLTYGNQNNKANPMTLAQILRKLSVSDIKYLHTVIAAQIEMSVIKAKTER